MRVSGFMAVAMVRLLLSEMAAKCESIMPVPQLKPCTKQPMNTCAGLAEATATVEPSLRSTQASPGSSSSCD